MKRFQELMRRFLLLLYPPKCQICGKILEEDIPVCTHCMNEISFANHAEGMQQGTHFARCYSACFYMEPLRQAFLRYKFGGCCHYSKLFGQWMTDTLLMVESEPFDCVTWVPLHPFRRWRRGYDQAMLLAQEVSCRLHIPLVRIIRKARYTPAQSGTSSPEKRRRNVRGAYQPLEGQDLHGKRVLLVDDIITTGSTLENAAAALSSTGAAEIVCLTLARSNKSQKQNRQK